MQNPYPVINTIIQAYTNSGLGFDKIPSVHVILTNILVQAMMALLSFQHFARGMHNNLQLNSFVLKVCDYTIYQGKALIHIPYFLYTIDGIDYRVPNCGILVKKTDTEFSNISMPMHATEDDMRRLSSQRETGTVDLDTPVMRDPENMYAFDWFCTFVHDSTNAISSRETNFFETPFGRKLIDFMTPKVGKEMLSELRHRMNKGTYFGFDRTTDLSFLMNSLPR